MGIIVNPKVSKWGVIGVFVDHRRHAAASSGSLSVNADHTQKWRRDDSKSTVMQITIGGAEGRANTADVGSDGLSAPVRLVSQYPVCRAGALTGYTALRRRLMRPRQARGS